MSPTLILTCAHVAGARFSDPNHELRHFRIRNARGNGIPLTPVWVGTDEPPHFDIAFLRSSSPLHDGWFPIVSARSQLYRVQGTTFTYSSHINVVCVFCEQALRKRRWVLSLSAQDCRVDSSWICRKRALWRAWNERRGHPASSARICVIIDY